MAGRGEESTFLPASPQKAGLTSQEGAHPVRLCRKWQSPGRRPPGEDTRGYAPQRLRVHREGAGLDGSEKDGLEKDGSEKDGSEKDRDLPKSWDRKSPWLRLLLSVPRGPIPWEILGASRQAL